MAPKWARALAAGLAAVLLLGAEAGAQVPDPYARNLAQRLARADDLVRAYGYSRAAGPFAGGLAQRETRRFPMTLRAGQDIRIVGVCEDRCRDLNISLYDANGYLVGQDNLPDALPVVEVRPRTTGVHEVEVTMARCLAPQCYFAFNVYAR